jgi:hypothetical protein
MRPPPIPARLPRKFIAANRSSDACAEQILGADDADNARPPLGGGLRHQSVDAVVVAAPSADAAATHTCATAPEIHRREQIQRCMRGTAAICRRRRAAAGDGAGGEYFTSMARSRLLHGTSPSCHFLVCSSTSTSHSSNIFLFPSLVVYPIDQVRLCRVCST